MRTLNLTLGANSYDIIIERACLANAGALLPLRRKVLIVTDSGVPAQYAQTIAAQCLHPLLVTVPGGEESKCFSVLEALCRKMLEAEFGREDCVVAVGGGVCGDLAGFAAASYMRGVDFYSIPTTLLSQVDSSIGGKTAINLDHIKNIVGAFYQPRRVLVDPDTLSTLPRRQVQSGLAEAVKMACTFDAEAFAALEADGASEDRLDAIIENSLRIKKAVVEQDEREAGRRKLLNFGHTIGHGIEAGSAGRLYHGECVALGMPPMCGPAVRARLVALLQKLGLPTELRCDAQTVWQAMQHDKKLSGDAVTIAWCETLGQGELRNISREQLQQIVKEAFSA